MNWRRVGLVIGIVALVVVAIAGILLAVFGLPTHLLFTPTESGAGAGLSAEDVEYETVADDLSVPWEVIVLEDGRYLVTERTGNLLLIEGGERHVLEEFDELEDPFLGEGGLLGIATHPDFEEDQFIYVYQTVDREGVENTVRRFRVDFDNRSLTAERTIIDGIPSDRIHNGGRIGFGPDGHLYVTTGDAADSDLAQQRDSLAGKILRLEDDGSVPPDNPFGTPVYSYGHRNPQGMTWDDSGQLWVTEHGSSARDELNLVEAGNNYGWPAIKGSETAEGMESPVFHSGQYETWAPGGSAYYDGSIFFAGLRGERLYEVRAHEGKVRSITGHFFDDFGRLRSVTVGPNDEYLYITTSNTDGRGEAQSGDDKLIRIPLSEFR